MFYRGNLLLATTLCLACAASVTHIALEINKANKQTDEMNEPTDVAGRKDKGMLGADKVVSNDEDGTTSDSMGVDSSLGGRNY